MSTEPGLLCAAGPAPASSPRLLIPLDARLSISGTPNPIENTLRRAFCSEFQRTHLYSTVLYRKMADGSIHHVSLSLLFLSGQLFMAQNAPFQKAVPLVKKDFISNCFLTQSNSGMVTDHFVF